MNMRMDREQFLEYGKQFEDRVYNNKEEVKEAVSKLKKLLEKFGFEFYQTYYSRCGITSNKPSTTVFYRYQIDERHSIEVQIGYILNPYRGVFRVSYLS